jgi:hypothetical protein
MPARFSILPLTYAGYHPVITCSVDSKYKYINYLHLIPDNPRSAKACIALSPGSQCVHRPGG